MALYMIAVVNVHDVEKYGAYEQGGMASLAEYGVETLAYGAPRIVEGRSPGERAVILKFKDQANFDAWLTSSTYQAVRPLRLENAETPFIMTLEGV